LRERTNGYAMSKRSNSFARIAKDDYPTPAAAVAPLLRQLRPGSYFVEPCVGEGRLIEHLVAAGHRCAGAYGWPEHDARTHRYRLEPGDIFVSNPPFTREVLHAIIANLSDQAPTWLLLELAWLATLQAVPFLPRLRRIIAIGRVKWFPDSEHSSLDDFVWCLFTRPSLEPAIFIGRQPPMIEQAPGLLTPLENAAMVVAEGTPCLSFPAPETVPS
jgi:hypothetical protein